LTSSSTFRGLAGEDGVFDVEAEVVEVAGKDVEAVDELADLGSSSLRCSKLSALES
jgi:hypothetical protein